jgi:cysteine desulfurase
MERIYLDYAATTPVHPDVIEAMLPYLKEKWGNPSSVHSFGQEARAGVEIAREQLASLIGALPEEIVFTSGGTEADNLALKGVAFAQEKRGKHILTTPIEHHAILEPLKYLEKQGFTVQFIPVDKHGLVNPEDVKKLITDQTTLVSVMHANNEIGTIEPLAEIGKILKERNIHFHTDAVQTVGTIPVNVNELGVDLLSLSGHKFYGPKGIGALYVKKGVRVIPQMLGGEQERRRRGSTENVPGIIGMGKAAEIAKASIQGWMEHDKALRDRLIQGLLRAIPDTILNGHPEKRLPKNVNVTVRYIEGESMLLNLDFDGIAASTGSACSSGSLEPSHVMLAIGKSHEEAHGSIRFSLGRLTTEAEIDKVIEVFPPIVQRLRDMSPIYKKK